MIDTANYKNYKPGLWKDLNENGVCDSNEPECVSLSGDRFFYAIYDASKRCNSADLGCSRLGEAVSSGNNLAWSDVFKRNNPNNYDRTLCNADDADCEAWQYTDGRGVTYFKNPGNDVCVYRNSSNPENAGKSWFKTPVMRCDLNNSGVIDGNELGTKICASASDCSANRPCILDNNDYECPVSYFETFGYGGGGAQVPVPSESAARCTQTASGCTEYLDPVSAFSANLVREPGLESSYFWTGSGASSNQDVVIEPNSLYVFSVFTENSALNYPVQLQSASGVFILEEDNDLSTVASTTLAIPSANPAKRFIFHSRNNRQVKILGANTGHVISLKKVIVDYQLQQNIDKNCNGLVNSDNGCILFNERSVNGASGLSPLNLNASASKNGESPKVCVPGYCDANALIKVRPDRTCASWLDCLTYTIDPQTEKATCYALGECDSLNEKGECINFVSKAPNTILNKANFNLNRLTGYSILDQYTLANMKEVGLNTNAHYDFEAASPTLYCQTAGGCVFDKGLHIDSIVNSPDRATTDYPAEGRAYVKVRASHFISPHSKNAPIFIQAREDYYINFLVNTKGSGYPAKIAIYSAGADVLTAAPLWSRSVSAPNGWERKVFKINTSLPASISLYLSVDTNIKESSYVYFDDINIEPVLEIGPDRYAAKECRLYPSQNAISCSSKNNKVIQDGLVGYCLQHDPANKSVCLLWYPIDEISSNIKSSRSKLGYQGAYPLNYCTEVNANFELVKKKKAYYLGSRDWETNVTNIGSNGQNYKECNDYDCFYPFSCPYLLTAENPFGPDFPPITISQASGYNCPHGYVLFSSRYERDDGGTYMCNLDYFCVPMDKDSHKLHIERFSEDNGCSFKPKSTPFWWTSVSATENMLVQQYGEYIEGAKTRGGECGHQIRIKVDNEGWYAYYGLFADEAKNADPAIRIFDYNYPTQDEDQLKLISSSDTEKVYYPTCNQFTQVVDSSGVNLAWADRTSVRSDYPFETPLFFKDAVTNYGSNCYKNGACLNSCTCGIQCNCDMPGDPFCSGACIGSMPGDCVQYQQIPVACTDPESIHGLDGFNFNKYGRSRELIPFGAATFPDNFNIFASEPIKLRNQYSSRIDQKVFAGRPYGCAGPGCANIGYCSLNPNVYCIFDDTNSANRSLVNSRSCGSVNGTCVPLWNGDKFATDLTFKPENILKNIFLQSFDGYKFSKFSGSYLATTTAAYQAPSGSYWSSINSSSPLPSGLPAGSHASTTFAVYWGAVFPKIENVSLKFNNKAVNKLPGGFFDVKSPGIYTLEFNTTIDPEQQPLKEIFINWGDGNKQTLVNVDHRPKSDNPHRIYHYYSIPGPQKVGIKIFDNWRFFGVSNWD
jgi:hypothetical protein